MTLRVREEDEIGYFVHYHTLSGDFRRKNCGFVSQCPAFS